MAFRTILVVGLLLGFSTQPLLADSQADLKSRVKIFCDTKAKLTELNIKANVQKLVSVEIGSRATAAISDVSIVQIANMHQYCTLLVGGYITPEQFLTVQTVILQFALDLTAVRLLAESVKGATSKDGSSISAHAEPSPQTAPSSKPELSTANKESTATGKGKSEASAPAPSPKNPADAKTKPGDDAIDIDIKAFAKELGITLKSKSGVAQSGNEDLVQSAMQRLIQNYSTVKLSE